MLNTTLQKVLFQLIFLTGVALVAGLLYGNMLRGMEKLGLGFNLGFIEQEAGFGISEGIEYRPSDTYLSAFKVGIINTLRVSILGVIFATVAGFIIGISRLSSNYLVKKIAGFYIESFRNVPLLLQILFWYGAVILQLPPVQQSLNIFDLVFINQRGIYIPFIQLVSGAGDWAVSLDVPVLQRFNFAGGMRFSPEFAALLISLSIYTSAFIAEIVRGGIQSVSKGQREAAMAVGLRESQVLRLVVIPQALRIIIPPLTNQYLNLAKNSSLAIAIGFPDLFNVGSTIMNQTGQSIPVFAMIMSSYLIMSLTTSLFLNLYNRKVRIVER